MNYVADMLEMPRMRVYEVTTFYTMFNRLVVLNTSLLNKKVLLIFNDLLVSSRPTLPVNIFTWKKKKPCSPGARKFSLPRASMVSSSSK